MSFWGDAISYQGGGDILRLDAAFVDDSVLGGPSTSRWRLDSDGGVYVSRDGVSGGAFIKQYDWVLPNASASKYECSWSTVSGTPDTAPVAEDSYAALTSDRTWIETNAVGSESCEFTARIRLIGGSSDLRTANITLQVDGSP